MMSEQEKPREGFSWKNRRRVVWASLAFCGGVIISCLAAAITMIALSIGEPSDLEIFESAIFYAFFTGAGIIGSYCFGAAHENRGLSK
jgi:hypothetical protein